MYFFLVGLLLEKMKKPVNRYYTFNFWEEGDMVSRLWTELMNEMCDTVIPTPTTTSRKTHINTAIY